MKHRTFFWFTIPSILAMVLFIALPLVSIVSQSFHIQHENVFVTVENCGPFGCSEVTKVDPEATAQLKADQPRGRFVGWDTYANRNHLAVNEISEAWKSRESLSDFGSAVMNLPFYRAMAFTLAYTFIVTPLVIVLGFFIALAVNRLPKMFKGPTIFVSLLPMIITPLIGSLILFWMIDADGVIGGTLQILFDDPDLSLKASPSLTWIVLFIYGVWSSAPFAFIVFYAGLQSVPQDASEAAMIDGATKWQQTWYVTIPHLMPLVVFITLIQLMDNFRVFEPIVGFSAGANATSLSWIIYNDLRGGTDPLFGSAAATSVMTVIGVAILMTPVMIRTWRDFNRKVV